MTNLDKLEKLRKQNVLYRWDLTAEELTSIIDTNPSLRGFVFGYVAEYKLKRLYFSDARVSEVTKDDDHNREKKGDIRLTYRHKTFRIESKSLQTNTIKKDGAKFSAIYQCDASDSRNVMFSDDSQVKTTCLRVGEFDLVAVNLFGFSKKWEFAFALNRDLPRSKFKRYTSLQQSELLASSMPITWPLIDPYVKDPFVLLDRLVDESLSR